MLNKTNQRRRERKGIEQLISVKDSLLDEDIGRVVNMHEDGFMLIGNGQIRENCLYQLSLKLSEPVETQDHLSVGAECLWLKETDSGTQYWAGFSIIDISEKDRNTLIQLVS